MCRLLGVVSTRSAPIASLVAEELPRLEALSEVHPHGWGMAHVRADGGVDTAKAPERAAASEAFHAAVQGATSDAALLHIRQASPGMPRTLANTHPFASGGMAFAHNGHAHPVATLDALVADAGAPPPSGDTDSERYFSLVRAGVADGGPAHALLMGAERISTRAIVTSLNAVLLTPLALMAIAWWHAPVIRASGDGETERDYRLWYRVEAGRITVGSTGVAGTGPGWVELPHGHVLVVDRGTLRTRIVQRDAGGPADEDPRGMDDRPAGEDPRGMDDRPADEVARG